MKKLFICVTILLFGFLFFSCQDSIIENETTTLAETTATEAETKEPTSTREEHTTEITAQTTVAITTVIQVATTAATSPTTEISMTTLPFDLVFPEGATQATKYNTELLWRSFHALDDIIEPWHMYRIAQLLNLAEVDNIVTVRNIGWYDENHQEFRATFVDENNITYLMITNRVGSVRIFLSRTEDGIEETLHRPAWGIWLT